MLRIMRLLTVPLICAAIIFGAAPAKAQDDRLRIIQNHIPAAVRIGSGEYTYFLMRIYQATLYAPQNYKPGSAPLALVLHYYHDLKGEKIAKASVNEMRKQGFDDEIKLAAWYKQMAEIFPDVAKGTELTGILKENGHTVFYRAGKRIGTVKDTGFGQQFFKIWLGEKTTAPRLRQQLLAGAQK